MNELIAIIIPIYNAEEYIEECVNSIICQTYKNIEIILVDDGSTDDSLKICCKIKEKDLRIKVFHKENSGPLSAKRLGLENTSAQYIMFTDADDWVMPNMCECLKNTMEEQDVDMVASGIIYYYSENECKYGYNFIKEGKYVGEAYKTKILPYMLCNGISYRRGIYAATPVKIYNKNILYPIVKKADEEYGYLFAEDTAIVYPYILEANSICILHDCFYFHRQYRDHIAVYVEEVGYEDKLCKLYGYLKKIFSQYDEKKLLLRQLDYFICDLLNDKYMFRAKKIVSKIPNMERYIFPYQRVPKGKRILLYGAGDVGQSYYAQLIKLSYCVKIIWEDRKYAEYQEMKLPVQRVDMNVEVDYCVTAVQDEQLANLIKDELISLGMKADKIIWEDPLLNMW